MNISENIRRIIRNKLLEAEARNNVIPFEKLDNSTNRSMITLYRVAFSNQLDSIFKNGYRRDFTGTKGGNMYGPGVYCTFNLEDSINNVRTKPEYGNCIVEMRLVGGFNGFIIFDENWAKRVYGDKWRIEDQLVNVAGFSRNTAFDITNSLRNSSDLYRGRTAPAAYSLWSRVRKDIFQQRGVRGLIYKGNRDGHCALPYDFSSVIPFGVSFDQGRTFQKRFNQELYNNVIDHPDVQFRYGGKYQTVFRAVKGFTMVKNEQGKYNLINSANDKLISPLWFDDVRGAIDPSTGVFGFTYGGFEFDGSIYTPDGGTEDGCILDSYGDPYCDFSDLKELVADMRSRGVGSFEEYDELTSQEEQNESVNRIINTVVESILLEGRTVDEDGVVTIDNFDDAKRLLFKSDSDDDVWFCQIIKRHKDNMHLHFRKNACEFITSYFIHNADELEAKRNEIIAVCKSTNSRAYLYPNKRSMISISDYANNVLKPRFKKYRDYDRMGHEMEVAAGQAKDWPGRDLCFLDVDTDDENVYKKVIEILKENGIEPLWEYRSLNNGWHILLPDKEKARNIDFSVIDNGMNYGKFSTVGFEIDKPILLYASLKPNGYGLQQRVQQRRSHQSWRKTGT